jgi:hypothetical protein
VLGTPVPASQHHYQPARPGQDDNFWPLTAGLASLPEPLADGDNVTPEHRGHINHPGPGTASDTRADQPLHDE